MPAPANQPYKGWPSGPPAAGKAAEAACGWTRFSSHFVTSYHLTSRTGGSLRESPLMRRVRTAQKKRRAACP